jgi:hypothetical protein
MVVRELFLLPGGREDTEHRAVGVGAGHLADPDLGAEQLLAQRHDDVARLDRPAADPG